MDFAKTKLTDITFHLMVESSPSAVILANSEGRIAYVNRRCESLFGYQDTELIGQSVDILVPDHLRAGHSALRQGYFLNPKLRAMGAGRELFAKRKDGTQFPIEIGLNPLVLVDGVWVLATVVDISERRRVEAQFRQIVQSAPNAMVLVNGHGKITLVNKQTCTLFGYEEHDLIGADMTILVPERFRPQHAGFLEGFFANPQTRYMGQGRDLVGLHRSGSEVSIEVGLNPVQTPDGRLLVLASIVDITERRVQQDLRARKEAAEAAYKAKGELLAIASHDLKNPLASIAGLAEIMLEMKKDDAGSQQDVEFLQSIYDASSHMSEVVKGILANEGLEQTGLSITEGEVALDELVQQLVDFATPSATRKQITLEAQITPGLVLRGDRTRLREAFDNYISNAVKYSPSGTTARVTLKPTDDGKWVEFGVRDQGPGLTEEDKAKLFGKFKKLSARPTGGESSTGLGLSIVKAIVELHGGLVGCDSVYGHGAYFWARLPRKA